MRRRLDSEMVRRGLVDTCAEAQRLIENHVVLIDGAVASKASSQVASHQNVLLSAPKPRFVSRAGAKLQGALQAFSIDPTAMRCLDVGSSTGGFTDCLLQAGASQVTAVDVGTHQLHERLRGDRRVSLFEQTDIRSFVIDERFDLIVSDVSFISLRFVFPKMAQLLEASGAIVCLVKPQFEADKQEASKGKGVITDPIVWLRILEEVLAEAEQCSLSVAGLAPSVVKGTKGNVEFVLHLRAAGNIDGLVDQSLLIESCLQAVDKSL